MLYILIACTMLALGVLLGFLVRWLMEKRATVLHYYGIVSKDPEGTVSPSGTLYRAVFPDFGNLEVTAHSVLALKSASLKALEVALSRWRHALKVPAPSNPKTFTLKEGDLGTLLTVVYLDGVPSPDLGTSIWIEERNEETPGSFIPSKQTRRKMAADLMVGGPDYFQEKGPEAAEELSGHAETFDQEIRDGLDPAPSIPAR